MMPLDKCCSAIYMYNITTIIFKEGLIYKNCEFPYFRHVLEMYVASYKIKE